MDENFLLHRKRALRLLELMEKNNKSWALYVFSSARVLESYTIEQLVGLGTSWVWMGIEGQESRYQKLKGVDTRSLIRKLQSHGIRVLGSSIIGMENHTSENIDQVIDYAVKHNTDFHQFMLYMPIPGTPLYEEHKKNGTLLSESEFSLADTHGQYRFNYRHPHIKDGQEEAFLVNAFQRDFEVNGPSLARLIRTMLTGWQRYKNSPNTRVRDRIDREIRPLRTTWAGAVWAMRKWYRGNQRIEKQMDDLLRDLCREFGWKTRLIASIAGRYAFIALKREEKRLANAWTYEPPVFYEKNEAARALREERPVAATPETRGAIPMTYAPAPVVSRRLQA